MLEKTLEKKVKDYAQKIGYLTFKFTSPSSNGVPDRIFINKSGYLFFIEFKSIRGKLSRIQTINIENLRNRGLRVYIIKNYIDAVSILEDLLYFKC